MIKFKNQPIVIPEQTYMKAFGAQATIPQICLWIEIFGNLGES